MSEDAQYSASEQAFSYASNSNSLSGMKKKKNNDNIKKRFSDEQIRSLESMFESETRLESRKKLQLATELGLHPRQVAIWFQNKRARWKSKQLERDYSILQGDYNRLTPRFEALNKETQALALQLQKLNDLVKRPRAESEMFSDGIMSLDMSNIGSKSKSTEIDGDSSAKSEIEAKPCFSVERSRHEPSTLSNDDDSSINEDHIGLEDEEHGPHLLKPVEHHADCSSMTVPENWSSFDSDGFLVDIPHCSYQWWDFWS